MAPIKPEKVLSFSSEDPHHPAENLLNRETFRKWRCKDPGESQASVVLQLDKPYRIDYVDIGNNGSALVEILVGRCEKPDQYEVLLPNSSFMTPAEAKSESMLHRVRMFGPDKLNKPVREQKWDRVRIVCTQPFSKSLAYGLSFIDLRNNDPDPTVTTSSTSSSIVSGSSASAAPSPKFLGAFKLRQESEDESDPIAKGSLFAQRKMSLLGNLSSPAAIRAAASGTAATSLAASTLKRCEKDLEEEEKADARLHSQLPESGYYQLKKESKPVIVNKEEVARERGEKIRKTASPLPKRKIVPGEEEDLGPVKKTKAGEKNTVKEKKKKLEEVNKRQNWEEEQENQQMKKAPKERMRKPFDQLFKDVVFVLSGFQNPLRAQLRDRAIAMGARYKPDWGPICTHLVCAFPNTPKFNEVKGQGKIVTKDWIEECFNQRKRLPWRRFALDKKDLGPESEDEIWEAKPSASPAVPAMASNNERTSTPPRTEQTRQSPIRTLKKAESVSSETLSTPSNFANGVYGNERVTAFPKDKITKTENTMITLKDKEDEDEYGGDTDIEGADDEDDAYDADTDVEEETDPIPASVPRLENFFEGKYFFIYGNFDVEEQKQLSRHVTAFRGKVEPYMNADVNYIITDKEPDPSFGDALKENPSVLFARPDWIWACVDARQWIKPDKYLIKAEQ